MTLIEVTRFLCQTQIEKLGLTADEFEESLPQPPDAMFDAIAEAVVDFFPVGQASHVREVLAKLTEVEGRMREKQIAKMTTMIEGSEVNARIEKMTEREFQKYLDQIDPPGEQPTKV